MTRFASLLASCAIALLAGCGQYLGEYSVEAVEIVRELPLPFGREVTPYGQYIEVDLSSSTSLTAIGDNVDSVYVDADFCPLRDLNRLVAFGPIGEDGRDLGLPSAAPRQRPNRDGRYRYRIFLVVAHPMPGVRYSETAMQRPRYDLRTADRDVCLRLFAPGYNLVASRSRTIMIPASLIADAARRTSASPQR